MHLKGKYGWIKHLDFILIDLISLFAAFMFSYFMKFGNVRLDAHWQSILMILLLLQLVLNLLMNPYSGILHRRFYEEVIRSIQMGVSNLILISLYLFLMKAGATFSRVVFVLAFVYYIVLSLALKYIWKNLLVSGKISFSQNKLKTLVIVGSQDSLEQVLKDATAADFQEYDIRAVFSVDGIKNTPVYEYVEIDQLERYVLDNRIDDVLITVDPKLLDQDVISRLIDNGIYIHINIESLFNLKPDDQFISRIGICKTVTLGIFDFLPKQRIYLFFKRFLDIIFGILGCIVLLPLMGMVKILNLSSGDHAKLFYRQKRIGKGGKEINIYKFRSMVPNADEILKEMLKDPKYAAEWAKDQKFENDPRITKAGNILRKTSLDEWPQFINVLNGDMSLIGPRPLVPGELEEHDGLQLYNKVRPGITGWWGCNGRSNIDYKERLDLEYHYIKHVSFGLDIICVFRTIAAILLKRGAK